MFLSDFLWLPATLSSFDLLIGVTVLSINSLLLPLNMPPLSITNPLVNTSPLTIPEALTVIESL